jgi:hypothetical protein
MAFTAEVVFADDCPSVNLNIIGGSDPSDSSDPAVAKAGGEAKPGEVRTCMLVTFKIAAEIDIAPADIVGEGVGTAGAGVVVGFDGFDPESKLKDPENNPFALELGFDTLSATAAGSILGGSGAAEDRNEANAVAAGDAGGGLKEEEGLPNAGVGRAEVEDPKGGEGRGAAAGPPKADVENEELGGGAGEGFGGGGRPFDRAGAEMRSVDSLR